MMVDALGDDVELDEIHGSLVMVDEPLHLFGAPIADDGPLLDDDAHAIAIDDHALLRMLCLWCTWM